MTGEIVNDSSHWRAFEEAELTHSAAHYLLSIRNLRRQHGYARITDVAEILKVSRGAASKAVSLLRERRYIEEDPHRMLLLTDKGAEIVNSVERNYAVAESFFRDVLGVDADIAGEDACKFEHLLNPKITDRLFALIRVMEAAPKLFAALREGVDSILDESRDENGEPLLPLEGAVGAALRDEIEQPGAKET